jgi:hypothetical protein
MHLTMLITVQRAQAEIKRLQHYVDLVESYSADTLEKWIIKEYAYTNSIIEVTKRANDRNFSRNGLEIDKVYVTSVIANKATDELHKILKSGYKRKAKLNKPRKNKHVFVNY